MACLFYMSSAPIVCGFIYFFKTKNWCNLYFDEKSRFGFVVQCFLYFLAQNLVYIIFVFLNRANINVGVVLPILYIPPLLQAIFHFFHKKTKMKKSEIFSLVLIIDSCLFLCFIYKFKDKNAPPSYLSIILALLQSLISLITHSFL